MDKYSRRAGQVAGVYALFGALWIIFSDTIVASLTTDPAWLTHFQTYKGVAYVLCTAAIVFFMARRVLLEQDALHLAKVRSEAQFRTAFEQAAVGMAHVSPKGQWLRVNDKLCEILARDRDSLLQANVLDMTHPDDLSLTNSVIEELRDGRRTTLVYEKRYLRPDNRVVWTLVHTGSVRNERQETEYYISVIEDISARKKAEEERSLLEAQFLQAQKLEAVGRLAGAVAHDFNNMLSVIIGYTENALTEVSETKHVKSDLEQVLRAAQRSTDLTRQLLAFARKSAVSPRDIDLNVALQESRKIISRLLGESITLTFTPGSDLWHICFDPSQLDQILANLAVNSRDAIIGKGCVEICTENYTCQPGNSAVGPEPGDYVRLVFRDTGCGMSNETLQRAFEPFFTTKPEGRGTGLGLATIFGIVQQNGGYIEANSTPGEGTAFMIYFPRENGQCPGDTHPTHVNVGGTECIVLVEDESPILNLYSRALKQRGYQVLTFGDAAEALSKLDSLPPIDLLLTDVMMPGMNGVELARCFKEARPGLKVLYMSGHTTNVIADLGVETSGLFYLQKPFTPAVLLEQVRRVLDTKAAAG